MFEVPKAFNVANGNEGRENILEFEAWRRLREDAPKEAEALINERIDASLSPAERRQKMIELMSTLAETEPQRYRFVFEHLARLIRELEIKQAADELARLITPKTETADSSV